ncbi:MAG: nucleotidyl transferase AbiEii/AbiGii toxin family protein [Pirellulaceae bacterium]
MTKDRPRNMSASVRQRLRNVAQAQREDFGLVLTRYSLERLLYRLAQSDHVDHFVLKGAMLFQLWQGNLHRPTRDLDLLGHGDPDPDRIASVFRDVCRQFVDDDGLTFHAESSPLLWGLPRPGPMSSLQLVILAQRQRNRHRGPFIFTTLEFKGSSVRGDVSRGD